MFGDRGRKDSTRILTLPFKIKIYYASESHDTFVYGDNRTSVYGHKHNI